MAVPAPVYESVPGALDQPTSPICNFPFPFSFLFPHQVLTHHVQILKAFIKTDSGGEAILHARTHNDLALLGKLGSQLIGCFVDHFLAA